MQQPVQPRRRHFLRAAAAATAMLPLLKAYPAKAVTIETRPHREYSPPTAPQCLLAGTTILTDSGAVSVERLQIGDLVMTAAGVFRPVTGIGEISYTKDTGAQWDESIAPVRIAQSAISAAVPARDLYLSPEHALFIDGYLIPAKYLVNGLTITQDLLGLDEVKYIHLEFEQHEVFYADGVAVESLLVTDARQIADGFARYEHDDSVAKVMTSYAPLLGYNGGRQEVIALARLVVHPLVDVRDRIQIIFDRLMARAKLRQSDAGETAIAA